MAATFAGIALATSAAVVLRRFGSRGAAAAASAAAGSGAPAAPVKVSDAERAFFAHVDANSDAYVRRLAECVAIPGVSAEPGRRQDVVRTVQWVQGWIDRLGGQTRLVDIGMQTLHDGSTLPLPPVLFASLGSDPAKKTLLVYGHLDVQPAAKSDGWNTDPFTLTEIDGVMYGRGSTDDKGPVLAWLCAIQARQELGQDIPLNIKFCLEGMEESGSVGLEELVKKEAKAGGFLHGVDYVCISDNYWLGTSKPCITYGLRGIATFSLTVQGPSQDLHSGVHGGAIHEPVIDLIHLMSSLVDSDGTIKVAGIADDEVAPVTPEERKSYDTLSFSSEQYRKTLGVKKLVRDDTFGVLSHRWRFPTLSLHGIEGAYSGTGSKTVIPSKVIGKFSIRMVPDMTPEHTVALVEKHVQAEFAKLKSPNTIKLQVGHAAPAWVADFNDQNFVAGRRAIRKVWNVEPDLTREGGSIPITLTFQEATGKTVLLLPVGRGDDMAHSQNEKLDRVNFVNGIKVLGTYINELAQ